MLERVDIRRHLELYGDRISQVACGGESGANARIFSYEWALDLRDQCIDYDVSFRFKQTGSAFEKDGRLYMIKRRDQVAHMIVGPPDPVCQGRGAGSAQIATKASTTWARWPTRRPSRRPRRRRGARR